MGLGGFPEGGVIVIVKLARDEIPEPAMVTVMPGATTLGLQTKSMPAFVFRT